MSWTSMFKWANLLNILVHDMINLLYYICCYPNSKIRAIWIPVILMDQNFVACYLSDDNIKNVMGVETLSTKGSILDMWDTS